MILNTALVALYCLAGLIVGLLAVRFLWRKARAAGVSGSLDINEYILLAVFWFLVCSIWPIFLALYGVKSGIDWACLSEDYHEKLGG